MAKRNTVTQERVKDLLSYDADSGVFTWRVRRSNIAAGSVAGSTHHERGYRIIGIDGSLYLAHRLAWLYMTGSFPKKELDHIDRNTDNNAFSNLRECSRRQNSYNTVRNPGATSRLPGVYFDKFRGKWASSIRLENGKKKHLGRFQSEEQAARAYREAKMQLNPFDGWNPDFFD